MGNKMESFNSILEKYRDHWGEFSRDEEDYRTIFPILHGLLERSQEYWNDKVAEYFSSSLSMLKTKRNKKQISNPYTLIELLKPALELGLPSQTPKDLEAISEIKGMFGVVREIEDEEVRISFSIPEGKNNPKAPLWESTWFNISLLPKAYQREDVWVAWIEYRFKDGREPVSNFEPASTYPK